MYGSLHFKSSFVSQTKCYDEEKCRVYRFRFCLKSKEDVVVNMVDSWVIFVHLNGGMAEVRLVPKAGTIKEGWVSILRCFS